MKKLVLAAILLLVIFGLAASRVIYGQSPSSGASDEVREKVEEKVNQVLKIPRAYIGTITDISETTLQLNKYVFNPETEKSGEIQQVSITSDTTYVDAKTTAKNIKFQDVAIGDFIIAMGYTNGNSVLQATRVLVIDALKPSTRTSLYLKVDSLNKTSLEGTSPVDDKSYTVKPISKAEISTAKDGEDIDLKLSEIDESSQIIAIGTLDGNSLDARKIFVIPQETTPAQPSVSPTPVPTKAPTQ
jgi:hypothetical protein